MHCFVDRELVIAVEPLAQRLAFDVRHHVIQKSRGFAGIVKRKDVRMIQSRRELDLSQEAVGTE